MNEHSCVPIKLYSQKPTVSRIRSKGYGLPTSAILADSHVYPLSHTSSAVGVSKHICAHQTIRHAESINGGFWEISVLTKMLPHKASLSAPQAWTRNLEGPVTTSSHPTSLSKNLTMWMAGRSLSLDSFSCELKKNFQLLRINSELGHLLFQLKAS